MRAEVISIGDELTSGQRLDTNCQWLSLRLAELGVETAFHTTVADDLDANIEVFRHALARADVVVATGGLGPTADDLTREVLARSVGQELVLYPDALAHVKGLFAKRGRPMPERNKVQAYFPASSRVIPNPQGTAPGIDLDVPREGRGPSRAFALPGVPAEMKEMWNATVGPAIAAMLPEARVIRHRRIKCFGVGESDLEQMLPDLIRRGRVPSVGITVHEATITLRITAAGRDEAECFAAMEPTAATIYECLGELVFGEEDDELQHAVVRLLQRRDLKLAVTEWGTGGLVARWLAENSGAEDYFAGGTLVTNNITAVKWLETDPEVRAAETFTQDDAALSRTTALLAEAARKRFNADIGLAIGRAPAIDPNSAEPQKISLALADRDGTMVRQTPYAGHSAILVPRAAKQALNLLRLKLTKTS
jgi:nicotinamide-nucleotide amidase